MTSSCSILHLTDSLDDSLDDAFVLSQLPLVAGQQEKARILSLRTERVTLERLKSLGLDAAGLDRRWRGDPFPAVRLRKELARRRPDSIHLWGENAVRWFRLVRRWLDCNVPAIATLNAAPAGILPRELVSRWIVPTEVAQQACLAQGIEPERLVLIPPAIVWPQQTPVTRERLNETLQLPADSRLVAVGGPLVRQRAVDEAIWAFELVRTVNPAARLLVLGDGPERLRLQRFARLAADASAVRFVSHPDDAAKVLPLAEVFWHTGAELPGAASLSVLEAIAVGVPVVATDVPCHRGLIEPGTSGFLAPLGGRALFARHTLRLLGDVRLGQQMGALAWGAARSLVAERVTQEYSALM